MNSDPGAIGVAIDSPYESLNDLVAAAKERPGEISFSVTSVTGQEGLTVKLIQKAAGVKFKIIPFDQSAEVMSVVVGKHVDAFCLNVGNTTNFVKDGQIKVIATGGKERSVFLPDVPTYQESGYDILQINMRSFGGPAAIPEPIRQYLENCFMAAAEDPEVVEKATKLQVPVDSLRGAEVKAKFGEINTNLKALWESDPWQ
jgi:tripartite-type tricarboxylate transporter receptor subunit TctC